MSILNLEIQKRVNCKRVQRPDVLNFKMPEPIPDNLLETLHEIEATTFEEFCIIAGEQSVGVLLEDANGAYSVWSRMKHIAIVSTAGKLIDINDLTLTFKAQRGVENVISLCTDGILFIQYAEEIANHSEHTIEIDDIRNIAHYKDANCTWYVNCIKTDLSETIELMHSIKSGIRWKSLACRPQETIKCIIDAKPKAIYIEDDDVLEYEDIAALVSRGINLVWSSSSKPSRAKRLYINSRTFKHPYASELLDHDDDFDDITEDYCRHDDLRIDRESLNGRRRIGRRADRRTELHLGRDDSRRSRRTRR